MITITKLHAREHAIRGFLSAVAIHLFLFMGYYIASAMAEKNPLPLKRRPPVLTDFILPPPIDNKAVEAVMPPSGTLDISKPVFGIPVPVPDLVGLDKTLPDMKTLTIPGHIGDSSSGKLSISEVVSTIETVKEMPKKVIPDPTVFVDFNEDPVPVQNIQQLVVYPEIARLSHIEGKVIASVYIGTDGRAEKVIIEKSDNEIFNHSTEEALLKARFTPARQDKTPVAVWWTVPISYKLTR
ncbi:MAG TPA: energy transducer TonB [Candidatus Kapabacteria bacterium]|nr:energy transducer TonB [Candidatus Kapabacteria bacterium]